MGVASLVLGIIAVVAALLLGPLGWIGIITGVIGIVLGALAKKKGENLAVAGLVLSIVGTALASIFFIACVACASAVSSSLNSFSIIDNL